MARTKLHRGRQRGNMNLMGRDRFEEQTPDLFPTEGLSGPSSNKVEDVKPRRPRRPALPKHLPTAIKYLNNEDLDRLLRAAMEGARRRGRLAPNPETPNKIEPLGEPSSKQSSANSSTTGEDRCDTADAGASERRTVNVQGRGHTVKDGSTVWLIPGTSPRGSLIR